MASYKVPLKLYEQLFSLAESIGRIQLSGQGKFNDLSKTGKKEEIGKFINKTFGKKCGVSPTSFRNKSNRNVDENGNKIVSEQTLDTLKQFIQNGLELDVNTKLKEEINLVLLEIQKIIKNEPTEYLENKYSQNIPIPQKTGISNNNKPVPSFLFGIYEGYFIRPLIENKTKHIAKLLMFLTSDRTVNVKSTRLPYDPGSYIFQESDDLIVCNFSGNNDSKTSIFQFNLTFDKNNFTDNGILSGIYGGTDPTDGYPICGKVIFKKLEFNGKTKNLEQQYSQLKNKVKDITNQNMIAEFFTKNPDIFNYLKRKDVIEDTKFFENFSIEHDSYYKDNIVGEYSIFSLDSEELTLNRGLIKIDRLGNVSIKGSRGKTYYGVAKIFANGILTINVFNVVRKGESVSQDYYFNYLIKALWEPDPEKHKKQNFFHGIRTILKKSDNDADKPSAARIILLKEENNFYKKNTFQNINILPYIWHRKAGAKQLKLNKDTKTNILKELYVNKSRIPKDKKEFIEKVIPYLIGEIR